MIRNISKEEKTIKQQLEEKRNKYSRMFHEKLENIILWFRRVSYSKHQSHHHHSLVQSTHRAHDPFNSQPGQFSLV